MIGDQLFFNDQELDLNPSEKIAFAFQIKDYRSVDKINSTLSNKFKVPKTRNNVDVLENSGEVQSGTNIPYRKNRAKYIKGGVTIINDGFAVIESVDSFYNITVYNGNVDFFDLIENKKLSDLDLSDMQHDFDMPAIRDSRLNDGSTLATAYKYSFINYGQLTADSRTIDPSELRMCVYVHQIFKKIIEEAGFDYEGDVLNSSKFIKLLVTTDNDNKSASHFDNLNNVLLGDNIINPMSYATNLVTIKPGETWDFTLSVRINVSAYTTGLFVTLYNDLSSNYAFPVTTTGIYNVTQTWSNTNSGSANVNGAFYIDIIDVVGGGSAKLEFANLIGTLRGKDTPDINVMAKPTNSFTIIPPEIDVVVQLGFQTEFVYGASILDAAKELGNMSQKEFIKSVGNLFCLMFDTDFNSKVVRVKRFDEIEEDIPLAEDWSDKLHDVESTQSLGFRMSDYSQSNYFKYTDGGDQEEKPKDYGSGILSIADETLATKKDLIRTSFVASKDQVKMISLYAPFVKRINDDNGKRDIDSGMRILIDDPYDISDAFGDITLDDGNPSSLYSYNTDLPLCYFEKKESDFSLSFSNTLLKDNYKTLVMALNKSKIKQVMLKLTELDIYDLDFFIPKYFKQFSAYFYVNKIINWTGLGLTKTELIKLGDNKQGMIGILERGSLYGLALNYGQINRNWPAGVNIFVLESMVLDQVEYFNNQFLTITAPGDLLVGVGLDGTTNYVMNVSDWLNSIMPEPFKMHDGGCAIDIPKGSKFEIRIKYIDTTFPSNGGTYIYNNNGFYYNGALLLAYTFEDL